jgi:hypothetical protein
VIPLSSRVPRRASGPSRSRIDDGGGLQYVFWKRVQAFRVFSSRRIYRWKGDVRGWTSGPHHLVARPRGGPRHPMAWLPSGPPPSLIWTPSHVGKNSNFGFCFVQFRENFLCNFLKHKNSRKQGTGTVASR